MRRPLHIAMGFLEVLVAVVLGAFAFLLPGPGEVIDKVGRVEAVSRESSAQVAGLRLQLALIRQRQPKLQELAEKVRDQVARSTRTLRDQEGDYERILENLADALGQTAEGIDGAAGGLDSAWLESLAGAMDLTADLIDRQVIPTARVEGARLAESARGLRADTRQLAALWAQAPPDVQVARSAYQILGQIRDGLGAVSDHLADDRLQLLLIEMKGMQLSLLSAADSAERLGSMTNPLEAFSLSEQKPKSLWPEGKQSARRLRALAAGVEASSRELAAQAEMLPALRAWVDASRTSASDLRRELAGVIQQRLAQDPQLRNTPLHVASIAENVLTMGEDIGQLLRQADRLRPVAQRLRQAHDTTLNAGRRLGDLRGALVEFSTVLRRLEVSLREARRAGTFRSTLNQTLQVLSSFADALPVFSEALETQLEEQDRSLGRLQNSVDRLSETLPESGRAAARLVQMARLLMLLMSGIFILHGVYLILASLTPEAYPRTTAAATQDTPPQGTPAIGEAGARDQGPGARDQGLQSGAAGGCART